MNLNLPYGDCNLEFNFPDDVNVIRPNEPKTQVNYRTFSTNLKTQLQNTTSNAKNINSIAIVISDKSRLAEFKKYLTWIEESIIEVFTEKCQINFFIAYGTHPSQSKQECINHYGSIYNKYSFIHHDPIKSNFKSFGKTSFGTEVLINELLFDNDLIITYGAISHHYFAGFGGGRKLLFPGLAAKKSILQNHSLYLNFNDKNLNTGCKSGQLKNNPVAEDLKEIYNKLPKSIGIHVILDVDGMVCESYIGDTYSSFEAACEEYENYYKYPKTCKYDLVIASAGGFPKDINFIQSHKSIHNASEFVIDGGVLIILCECKDGIGNPELTNIINMGSNNKIYQEMEFQYHNNGGTALSLLQKTKRIKIEALTKLSNDDCEILTIKKTSSNTIQSIIYKSANEIAVIDNASYIYI